MKKVSLSHPWTAFLFSGILAVGSILGGLVAFADTQAIPFLPILVLGILGFIVIWVPLTLSLHGACRLLGGRAGYGSLQTQVALSLWPLAVLPGMGLLQFLSGWDSKILFCAAAAGAVGTTLFLLRQGLVANYGVTKSQATLALAGALWILIGFLGLLLAGLLSGVLLWVLASNLF